MKEEKEKEKKKCGPLPPADPSGPVEKNMKKIPPPGMILSPSVALRPCPFLKLILWALLPTYD